MSKRHKYAAGILTGVAVVVTFLVLFLTWDQQPAPPQQATTPSGAYPGNVETSFLASCEANGPQSVCECSLAWFERNVPISQFEADIAQGGQPDIAAVEQSCG